MQSEAARILTSSCFFLSQIRPVPDLYLSSDRGIDAFDV